MTTDELKRLRALCADGITPGPWRASAIAVYASDCAVYINHPAPDDVKETRVRWAADAKFIAESRAAMPALLDEVERLRAQIDIAGDLLLSLDRAWHHQWHLDKNKWIKENEQ